LRIDLAESCARVPPFEREPEHLMRRRRTTARGFSLLLLLGLSAGVAAAQPIEGGGSSNAKPAPVPNPGTPGPKPASLKNRMIFPLVGQVQYQDDFGQPRPIGNEEGNDLMTPRHTPVVAPEAAKVKFWTDSGAGCMMYLYGKSGTTYVYLHMNNDLTKHGNDNKGKCGPGVSYAPGLKSGQRVAAGQLVGFSGDSGNANGIPHLEYQMHPHDGRAVDPYKTLNRSLRLLFVVTPGSKFTLSFSGKVMAASASTTDIGSASLKLNATSIHAQPGNLTFSQVNRPITLTVTNSATVQQQGAGPATAAVAVPLEKLMTAKKGQPLVVRTMPAKPTLQAQLGKVTLDAASVTLKPLKP
jgi:hypothetical protein